MKPNTISIQDMWMHLAVLPLMFPSSLYTDYSGKGDKSADIKALFSRLLIL